LASFSCTQNLVYLDQQWLEKKSSDETIALDKLCNQSEASQAKQSSNVASLPLSFWLICMSMCFYYAVDIPFNTIHSSFLQSKWYRGYPKTAAQIMVIPDIISALLVPFVGTFVDFYGHRCKTMIVCGCLMTLVHLYFALASPQSPSPIPFLVVLGFSYSLLLTYWPCISIVVPEEHLSTAFGLATSLLNASLALFPMLVAYLLERDPTYTLVEFSFVSSALIGLGLSIVLYFLDSKGSNVLESPISKKKDYSKLFEEEEEL
jgi:predicted MFS family arabinose efflux permease